MSVSTNLSLVLLTVLFTSCRPKDTDELKGTWKIIKGETEFILKTDALYQGVQPMEIMEWEPLFWTFYKDSIMQSNYPNFAHYFHRYKITTEDSILNSDYYDYDLYSKRFSADTLILKRKGPKYFETFYFLKQDVDENQIELLKTTKVDWSYYRQKWRFERSTESSGMKCSRNFPPILDLTEFNFKSYEFEGNILKYWQNDTLHRFQFSTAHDDKIYFDHVCDFGCRNLSVSYSKHD